MYQRIKYHKFILIYPCILFSLYFLTRSISFDDWDSIQFGLGLNDFDIIKHQPHPPGYPVYILMGKFFYWLLQSELQSLTLLSSILGALTIVAFYFLVLEMFNQKIAILASILLSITPMFWMLSIKALSDMPALFFVVSSLFFLYKYLNHGHDRSLYIGIFLSGISVGVRFHYLYFFVPVIFYVVAVNKNNCFITIKSFGIYILSISLWLFPMIYLTGFKGGNFYKPRYYNAALNQFLWRFDEPSVSVLAGKINPAYLIKRIYDNLFNLASSSYGIELNGLEIVDLINILTIFIMFFFVLKKIHLNDKRFLFCIPSIILYTIITFIVLPPHNPRYWLVLIPFFCICLSLGATSVKSSGKYLLYVLFAIFALSSTYRSIIISYILKTTFAPPIQVINFLNKNYKKDDTVIIINSLVEIARFLGKGSKLRENKIESMRKYNKSDHFHLENETYGNYYPLNTKIIYKFDCNETLYNLKKQRRVFEITIPGMGSISSELKKRNCENIIGKRIKLFHRDRKAHRKHAEISLDELFLAPR